VRLATVFGLGLLGGCVQGTLVLPSGGSDPNAWAWGDLHAHSGWSYDSCEDAEADCAARDGAPASDFFAQAARVDLDFAALTDHAEADLYLPLGDAGDAFEVWEGQQEVVLEAAEGTVLPLLGYEWSAFRSDSLEDRPRGSHRTVILADELPCEGLRVAGWTMDEGRYEPTYGTAVYTQDDDSTVAETPGELWELLDAAAEGCDAGRWLSFAHHPAYATPQQNDWLLAENAPDRETLVEIFSEHGSSECWDTSREGCEFALNEGQGYYPDGAVQRALDEGFQLGFVAGTDSHDGRPGSVDDGPGTVGHWEDSDEDGEPDQVLRHFSAGGLTGVYLPDGLHRTGLFDALEARRTVASSGPRPAIAAWALGKDGGAHLPGTVIPDGVWPVEIRLQLDEPEEGWVLIERISGTGKVADSVEDTTYQGRWDPPNGAWTYLRVRYFDDQDNELDRLWISPWWASRSRGCGCAVASERQVVPWIAVLGIFLLGRRRRGHRDSRRAAIAGGPGRRYPDR